MINAEIHKILFGPDENIESFIISQINSAKKGIIVLAFWFTWKPIADSLIEAHQRGVKVRLVLDKRSCEVKLKDVDPVRELVVPRYLESCGINKEDILIYDGELMHHKTILIDDDIVLTGTCNFFNASINRHEEVYMLMRSKKLKDVFKRRFDTLTTRSKRWNQ